MVYFKKREKKFVSRIFKELSKLNRKKTTQWEKREAQKT
jgi:hypothetical protein